MNNFIKDEDYGIEVGSGAGFAKDFIKNKFYLISEDTKNTINSLKEITSSITIIKTEVKKTEESCFSIENWINES